MLLPQRVWRKQLTVLLLSLTTPGRPRLGAAWLPLLFLFCCQRQSCSELTGHAMSCLGTSLFPEASIVL